MFRPNAYKFCALQNTCRPYAYKFCFAVQNIRRPDNSNSVLCRLFADSMHTLRRTNQCQSKCRSSCGGGPLAAAGAHRGRQAPASCAKPHRFARDGETAAREGEAAAREGEAAAREGEAGGGAAREGEAVRLSALEVLRVLPAATAAPRASGIQSLSAPRPPLVS